jgi:hypothetical protein
MASALDTKINSYALRRGMELSQAVTATPTRTGSNALGTWVIRNPANVSYDTTTGPAGGAGSWKFTQTASNVGGAFDTTTASELVGIDTEDWTFGIWFKVNPLPNWANTTGTVAGLNILRITPGGDTAGFTMSVTPTNITNTEFAGRMIYSMTGAQNAKSPVVTQNAWHYGAVRRVGTTMEAYYDGVLVGTETNTNVTTAPGRLAIGNQSVTQNILATWWASNFHSAPASVLTPTAIAEIWAVGNGVTPPRTVKYYDGTAWQTSSAQKVYNGTAWVDWNAKRFDGTTWVTI